MEESNDEEEFDSLHNNKGIINCNKANDAFTAKADCTSIGDANVMAITGHQWKE